MTENNDTVQNVINRLRAELQDARIGEETYKRLLVDYYGFDPMNPPPRYKAPLAAAAEQIGKPLTIGGDIIEGPDGPAGVNESITAPVIAMVVTENEVRRDGIDPATPGLTILDADGNIIRKNELEDDDDE